MFFISCVMLDTLFLKNDCYVTVSDWLGLIVSRGWFYLMENKINLFETASERTSKLESQRPTRLDLAGLQTHKHKWAECKIYGKNVFIRSYAGACSIDTSIYVYGGLQILNGVLADFHKIDVRPKQNTFAWVSVPVIDNEYSPGPRAKHAMVAHQNKIYLVGGIKSALGTTNEMSVYDVQTMNWNRLQPQGVELPHLQTFGCVLVSDPAPKIIVLCGYDGQLCQCTNAVYSYDITSNTLSSLFQHSTDKTSPIPRLGCGVTFNLKDKIYLFGGKSEEERFNDFWYFDLHSNKYNPVKHEESIKPMVRNGHSMTFYQDKILIFGGIHDVTWELDDLYIYDISKGRWASLETDSARKRKESGANIKHASSVAVSVDKKVKKDTDPHIIDRKKSMTYYGHSPGYSPRKVSNGDGTEINSPGKTINQLKHKVFLQKKTQMLKMFEVKEEERGRYLHIQPSSQAMKNFLDIIGHNLATAQTLNRTRKGDFSKTTTSKFTQPLTTITSLVLGKKPCARDGHNAILIDKEVFFFGGDRHHMSFNDMYVFSLDVALFDLSKH